MKHFTSRATARSEAAKALLSAGLVLIFIYSTGAVSFGSYAVDSEKQVEALNSNFTVKVFNFGDQPLKVDLVPRESGDYNVSVPEAVVVPGSLTGNPSGSGWYYLGNGMYSRTRTLEFRVEASRFRSSNSLKIPVAVQASSAPGTSTGAKVVYSQEHSFRMLIEGIDPVTRTRDKNLWGGKEKNSGTGRSGEKEGEQVPKVEVSRNFSVNSTDKGKKKNNEDKSSFGPVTVAILGGIIFLVVYIYRLL